ncbi:carbohydrate ABC transporter permease [Lacrimispora sp. 210928-DFI.3.58]|uniref:carbohydrate ABC transporter permease n=1 Tax=Lacrimispora sp. 210928-DFI.3.58 TaxID=2883214 RepID=UPI0015B64AAA|nr:carbohydrate ABC transporter permease [Lacrimispora sp. 210928-DFI.3.58]MCB7318160.1 carbohydrate ABC transporter permease [Lacrimispora sp. 210928-DFI.3.58]
MKVKRSRGERIFSVCNYIILSVIVVVCFYPVWYVGVASFSDSNLLSQHTGVLFKSLGFSLDAYKRVFANPMISRGYMNTLFILTVGVVLDIFMTSLGAYFLSRKRVMFKKPIMMFIMFTMFFSGGMIPFYLNLQKLHLTNTLWGLILPFMINTYNLVILRTSFESIPESLIEAAQIDGAGHLTILMQIVLPLSKAILAVMVLYYGVSIWNSWFWASAIIRNREMYPLQVILREILMQNDVTSMATGVGASDQESVAMTIKYATIMVATIPILFVYPFLQKYFAKGTMVGAVKE